jgi:hypothetical protein
LEILHMLGNLFACTRRMLSKRKNSFRAAYLFEQVTKNKHTLMIT